MSAQRILVTALVVIAVLFVISVAAGSSHRSQPVDAAGIVSNLKGLRSKPLPSFDTHDRATCATGPTTLFLGSQPCAIVLDKRGILARPIRLVLVSNATGSVGALVQPNSGGSRTATLNTGDCFDTAVNHSGGTITLSGPAGAALSLVEGC